MAWPTLPAPSPNCFLDHFDAALDATKWASVVSGTGTFSITDSFADMVAPASSAAFMYATTKIDKTKSQLWLICSSLKVSGNAGVTPNNLMLMNGSAAPSADTKTNIDARTILRFGAGGTSAGAATTNNPFYFSSGSVQTFWNPTTPAWSTTFPGAVGVATRDDDFYIYGLEIDGPGNRFRLLQYGQAAATAGTYQFDQGWRLFLLTDWVSWANVRDTTDLWLVSGYPYTSDTNAHEVQNEWIRYVEAPAGNTVVDAFSGVYGPAGNFRIKHFYSLDGQTFVPQDRATFALNLGAAASWEETEVSDCAAVSDGTTDYIFYVGVAAGGLQAIGVATTPSASPQNGAWTKFGSNPVLQVGAGGANDDSQIGSPSVVYDLAETDPNKRWKMLYAGRKVSDSKWRTLYATAPAATGPWTKQGTVIDVGGAGANDELQARDPAIVNYGGQWEVYYTGIDASNNTRIMRATGTNLGVLAKDGVGSYFTSTAGVDQALTANLNTMPGRTVTVADTTGFARDATVVFSQSTSADVWSASKIRKIVSGTVLELYHGVTGFLTTYPARVKQEDSAKVFIAPQIVQAGAEWWFYVGFISPYANSAEAATYTALASDTHLLKHSAPAPSGANPTLQQSVSPIVPRGFNSDQSQNIHFTLIRQPFTAVAGSVVAARIPNPRVGPMALRRILQARRPRLLVSPTLVTSAVSQTVAAVIESLQGVAQTILGPLDAAQGLTAAATAQVEAAQTLATAVTGAVESTANLASTAAAPVEAAQTVPAATAATIVEALNGLAAAFTGPVEAAGGLTAPATSILDALQAVAAAATDPIEAQGNTPVAATTVAVVETLAGVTTPAASTVETVQAVTATTTAAVESLTAALAAVGVPVEAAQTIAAAAAVLPVETAAAVAITRQLPVEALQIVAAATLAPLESVAATPSGGEVPGSVTLSASPYATVLLLAAAFADVTVTARNG